VAADEEGARLVLYAGQPQGNPIVSYGPFVGDSKEDIVRLFTEYRAGQFVRMSELARRLNREQLNSCYYLLLFSVMMRRFWAAVGFIGLC
jgi:hypothetical protein